jgi:adenylate cyclase
MDRVPRRLSAIVCVDVVGYGRLIALDEERTLRALAAIYVKQVEPAVARHAGRVVKTTGDGVLLEFTDAVDAVRAAVELQEGVARSGAGVSPERRVELRVGVNLGDVVVFDNGDIMGEAVNVAARLESLAEPGGICITDRVRDALAGKLELPLRDLGEQRVKNIDRALHVWQWTADGPDRATPQPPTLPDKPSIVVLPFDAMGGDATQQAFAGGITEDIIAELSRFRQLFVIARNSAFTYKGKPVDVRQVATELGVRYVLEGSMRRSGNRVRVTAQLIEAESGAHLWAERYDRVVEDIFDVQDAITRRIVAAVAPEVEGAELALARRARPADLKAHEIALQAWAEAWQSYTRPDSALRNRAIARAEEALRIDPNCVRALITLALAHWQHANFRTSASFGESVRLAVEAATKAQHLDRLNHQAFMFRGLALMIGQRFEQAMMDIRHAYDLNSSDPGSLIARGWCEVVSGNTKVGVPMLLDALRVSPRDPQQYNAYTSLCAAGFVDADYASGVEWGVTGKRKHASYPPILHYLALNYVGLGQLERAAAEIETLRRVAPEWLAERLAGFSGLVRPADRQRGLEFLRRAVAAAEEQAATDVSLDPWS